VSRSLASPISVSEEWVAAARQERVPGRLKPETSEVRQFVSRLWPMAGGYRSPIEPVFLMECDGLASLRGRDWLVRDGAVPLCWFFSAHPSPALVSKKSRAKARARTEESFDGILYLHESCQGVVPEPWRKHVRYYRLVSRASVGFAENRETERRRSRLLLCGLVMPPYCGIDAARKLLQKARESLFSGGDAPEVAWYFHVKVWGWGIESDPSFAARFFRELVRELGNPAEIIEELDFAGGPSFSDYYVLDLNERLLLADPLIPHVALSRGARLAVPGVEMGTPTSYFPLSPFHGVELLGYAEDSGIDPAEQLWYRKAVLGTPAGRCYPWRRWFSVPAPATTEDA
jgi:hypothetical protein